VSVDKKREISRIRKKKKEMRKNEINGLLISGLEFFFVIQTQR
jgi:hypothetical protein